MVLTPQGVSTRIKLFYGHHLELCNWYIFLYVHQSEVGKSLVA